MTDPITITGFLDGKGGLAERETRWLTPHYIVEALGEFDLDPCGAPGHSLAKRTYLLENGDDGLRDPWEGRIWCNPPYGKEAAPFLQRMAEHNHGTALIFARVETKMFHSWIWDRATSVLFLKGRIRFLNAAGEVKSAAAAPSCLVAYGNEDTLALAYSGLPGRLVLMEKTYIPRKVSR